VPTLIRDVSIANRSGWSTWHYDQLEVRFGMATVNSLSNTFTENVTSPMTTVLHRNDHTVTYGLGETWSPLGLDEGFWFHPAQGKLLIEVVVRHPEELAQAGFADLQASTTFLTSGRRASFTLNPPTTGGSTFVPGFRFCTDQGTLSTFGVGCAVAGYDAPVLGLSGSPMPGGASTFWLSTTIPNGLALLLFGEQASFAFPVDLASIGAPGCLQYLAATSSLGITTNGLGIGSHTIQIPNNQALVGTIVLGQFANLTPGANARNVLTSNYGRLQVGL